MSAKDPGPRLGRGLAALLGDAPAVTARGTASDGVQTLPVELLEPGPYQPRGPIDETALNELANSIRVRGVLQPLLARPHPAGGGRYQIVAGERRWRAAQRAGVHELPVLVRTLSDADAMAAALVENLQRQDLNAIEEAEGYRRLIEEFGMTQERLAEAVGKSRSHVANTLRLLNLPPTVQHELRNGAITAGHARALLSHPEPEKAALAVISRGLNVRQTEAFVAESATRPAGGSGETRRRAPKDADTVALERQLSDHIGLKVEIQASGSRGVVRIEYRALDQLDSIVTLLSG